MKEVKEANSRSVYVSHRKRNDKEKQSRLQHCSKLESYFLVPSSKCDENAWNNGQNGRIFYRRFFLKLDDFGLSMKRKIHMFQSSVYVSHFRRSSLCRKVLSSALVVGRIFQVNGHPRGRKRELHFNRGVRRKRKVQTLLCVVVVER